MIENELKLLLADVLQLGDKAKGFNQATLLLGSLPELDSMGVVSIITALEEAYGFSVDDDEISEETFETFGSLLKFVETKLS